MIEPLANLTFFSTFSVSQPIISLKSDCELSHFFPPLSPPSLFPPLAPPLTPPLTPFTPPAKKYANKFTTLLKNMKNVKLKNARQHL